MYAPVHDGQNFEDSLVASPIDTSAGASPINNSAWISPTTITGTPASPTEVSAWANGLVGPLLPIQVFSFCLSKEMSQGAMDVVIETCEDLMENHILPQMICKEYIMFENPHTGKYQLSREQRNVYYNARMSCVQLKFPIL